MSISAKRLRQLMRRLPRGEPVAAISLRQPWACDVVLLGKDVENRSNWPFMYRGPMVIHASRSPLSKEELDEAMALGRENGVPKSIKMMRPDPNHYDPVFFPQGAIIALADLTHVFVAADGISSDHGAAGSPWADDEAKYWLCFDNVAAVKPTEHPGRVGLFKVPYEIVAGLEPLTA